VGLGSSNISDETLSIINKSKHPKRGGIQGTKKEKPMSKKTKEPPKEGKTTMEHQVHAPLLLQEVYQIMKGEELLKGCLA